MTHPAIYLDADDVERGYYVYAHACKKTGVIFYIGKGKESRAWNDRRSSRWHEHVAALEGGYEVLLLHQDLTEEESIELERIEIDAHGGPASQGGSLVNWIPGEAGNGFGVAVTISASLGQSSDPEARAEAEQLLEAYRQGRKYKQLTKVDKDRLAKHFEETAGPALESIESLFEEYFRSGRYLEFPRMLEKFRSNGYEISRLARQIRHRKMKYVDFCDAVEQQIDQLEDALEDAENDPQQLPHVPMCRTALNGVMRWCESFADGSREEAEEARDRLNLKRRFLHGADSEQKFAQYAAAIKAFFGEKRAAALSALRRAMLDELEDLDREKHSGSSS